MVKIEGIATRREKGYRRNGAFESVDPEPGSFVPGGGTGARRKATGGGGIPVGLPERRWNAL